jgi:hypothetical protein
MPARGVSPEGVVTSIDADGFDETLRERTVRFRGRTYVMRELPIGDYDEIIRKSVDKIEMPDGSIEERTDQLRQSRLLMAKCMVSVDPPLPRSGIPGLGTAIIGALTRIVDELHYVAEVDELAPKPTDGEAAPAGNA